MWLMERNLNLINLIQVLAQKVPKFEHKYSFWTLDILILWDNLWALKNTSEHVFKFVPLESTFWKIKKYMNSDG